MSISIRQVSKDSLSEVLGLYAQPDFDKDVLSLEQAQQLFERMASYPDYKLYLARQAEQAVGTFALLIVDNLGHQGAKSAIIEDVVVADSHRGQGVGRVMMQYALELCREKGCYKAMLSSSLRREKAHEFYKNLGFVQHGYSFLIDLVSPPSLPSE
ncbi:GNAT family N-acetyltransferase [Bowmanella denitrificans]|uniref:GNAT family N-acetyltransferase n=1 Tax=Bowmanella denitrificans TaxID=366582 RepID=UPI000C99CD04|nr:GNAT family N-acetyltransferase [Bowmanella denitrificans]